MDNSQYTKLVAQFNALHEQLKALERAVWALGANVIQVKPQKPIKGYVREVADV